MSYSLYEDSMAYIKRRRQRIIDGFTNSISWGFTRFEDSLPGIEEAKYYIATGNSKVGKTQLSDFMFLFKPYEHYTQNRANMNLRIRYYTLEMSPISKQLQLYSYVLYKVTDGKFRIPPVELRSTKKALDENVIFLLEKHKDSFLEMEKVVTFHGTRNPYGIYKESFEDFSQNFDKVVEPDGKIRWVKKDKTLHQMLVIDNYNNLGLEKGLPTLYDSISKMSEYNMSLRDTLGISAIAIQQQAGSKEGLDNFKMGKLEPSLDGIGDNKSTGRDADYVIGIYSPFRHEIPHHGACNPQYDVTKLQDNYRSIKLLASREGGANSQVGLFFDGAVNYFQELPPTSDIVKLNEFYNYSQSLRAKK